MNHKSLKSTNILLLKKHHVFIKLFKYLFKRKSYYCIFIRPYNKTIIILIRCDLKKCNITNTDTIR